MIASWMAYAALVSALVTLAALGFEQIAAARQWPSRLTWLGALVLSVMWPVGGALRHLMPESATPDVLPFAITVLPAQVIGGASGPTRAELIDRALVACWILGSIVLLIRLAGAALSLRRVRDAWRKEEIDGVPVRLASNVGPAVVGLRSMEIVLPEWIVALDTHLRAIVLRHEDEHRRARDPYLLFGAAVAVALMPWNVALWLQARRLRLAIELDCDARVLRAHPSPERYGLLMMTIAQRRSTAPTLFAPMLTEPATQLERRIRAMSTTGRRVVRAAIYGGLAAGAALLFACTLKSDSITTPVPSTAVNTQVPAKTEPQLVRATDDLKEFQVEQPAKPVPGNPAPRYPDLLRSANVSGSVVVQYVVDTTGHVEMSTFKVLKSTHDLFTAAVRAALPQFKYTPARVGGKAVRQLVTMPIEFALPNGDGSYPAATATGGIHIQGARPATNSSSTARLVPGPAKGLSTVSAPPGTYFEFQVTKAVSVRETGVSPRYPDMLRSANVEGSVLAQFVVDEDGRADPSTFKVLKSTHDLFTAAVLGALPQMRFNAAELNGRAVKQIVQMPFQFSLSK